MNDDLLVLLFGRSCVGKTTTVRKLKEKYGKGIHEVVSLTTRPIRPGEIDGVDYKFISEEYFLQRQNEGKLIENVYYNGNHYGLDIEAFRDNVPNIAVVEPSGVEQVVKQMSDRYNILIIKMDENDKTIFERFKKRGDSVDTVYSRFPQDKKRFSEIDFSYLINADEFLLESIIKRYTSLEKR